MEGEGGSGCERDGRRDAKENGERWKEGSLVSNTGKLGSEMLKEKLCLFNYIWSPQHLKACYPKTVCISGPFVLSNDMRMIFKL